MLYLENVAVDFDSYDARYFQHALTSSLTGYLNYRQQERPLRKNFIRYFDKVKVHLTPDTAVMLDVGCAYGFLIDEARKLGISGEGVDLSKDAIQWMEENLGIMGTVGTLADAPSGPFDLITASEVIEHVPEPARFMSELARRLVDGGILLVVTGACDTPCARLLGRAWWYLNPPDHCSIYSRAALRMLVSEAGMEVLDQRIFFYHWIGLNNGVLKVARMLGSEKLGRLALKLPSLMCPFPHGTTQFLIARKRSR